MKILFHLLPPFQKKSRKYSQEPRIRSFIEWYIIPKISEETRGLSASAVQRNSLRRLRRETLATLSWLVKKNFIKFLVIDQKGNPIRTMSKLTQFKTQKGYSDP